MEGKGRHRVALRNSMDIKLSIGDVAESVEVKAEVPMLETTTATRGQNISPQLVASLPVFSGRRVRRITSPD